MPASKSHVAAKAALLAPVGPITAWGVQTALGGEPVTGTVAVFIGALFVTSFVAVQEYDIPYEQEIIDALASADTEETVETAKDVSERAGEYADQHTQGDGDAK